MTVKYLVKYMSSSKKTPKPFSKQEFFNDFDWENFSRGDIVWLEDYGKPKIFAGVFLRIENDGSVIIRLIPNKDGDILARDNSTSLYYYNPYWERYLKG